MDQLRSDRFRGPAPAILLAHSVIIFILGLMLFVSKWFPYGPLKEIREWLYRFF
ncbi:MAG: hypothetical protein JW768_13455 [Chitinispirillaceae bacterium]|nr:hypothetical protein [Chitinispirillaceae bacterium]